MKAQQFGIGADGSRELQRRYDEEVHKFQRPGRPVRVVVQVKAQSTGVNKPEPKAEAATIASARDQLRERGKFQLPSGGRNPAGRKVC